MDEKHKKFDNDNLVPHEYVTLKPYFSSSLLFNHVHILHPIIEEISKCVRATRT